MEISNYTKLDYKLDDEVSLQENFTAGQIHNRANEITLNELGSRYDLLAIASSFFRHFPTFLPDFLHL